MGSPSSPAAPEATQVAAGSKAPIPVEESRAQRLQRQQARFRDRGGIFVPSNRNTLGDILCGRSAALSPGKPRKRPESVSPRKGKGTPFPEVETSGENASSTQIVTRRTSPRKPSSKQVLSELEDHLEPIPGSSRLHKKDTKSPKRLPASRKGKAKADDTSQNPRKKRRGRPPKAKVTLEVNKQSGNISTKAIGTKSTSKLLSKPPEVDATKSKSTTKAAGSRRQAKKSTKAPEDEGRSVLDEPANADVASKQGSGSKGKARARGQEKPSSAAEIVKTVSATRRAPLSDDGHDMNTSDPEPDAGEAKPPITSVEHPKRSGRGRKPAAKKTQVQQRKTALVEENSTELAQETERMKPTSRKRSRPDTHCRDTDDDLESESAQASRKRTKATQRKGVEPGEMTVAKNSVQASTKPTHQATPMSENLTSKKRSREDAQGGTDIESLRKRRRPTLKEDTTTTAKDEKKGAETSAKDDQGLRNAKKALKLASRKLKENTLAAAESVKPSKATKPSIAMQPLSKRKGPPASVLKRIKQPLPKVEDDDPDPINFLL